MIHRYPRFPPIIVRIANSCPPSLSLVLRFFLWDDILVGKSSCIVGGVFIHFLAGFGSFLSTANLFKYCPHIAPLPD